MPHQSARRQGVRRIRRDRRPALCHQWRNGCPERSRHQDAEHAVDADEGVAGDKGCEGAKMTAVMMQTSATTTSSFRGVATSNVIPGRASSARTRNPEVVTQLLDS